MATATVVQMVVLKDRSVSVAALQLLLNLEDRGFTIYMDGSDLIIRPRSQLTAADVDGVRDHRQELVSLIRLCEDGASDPLFDIPFEE